MSSALTLPALPDARRWSPVAASPCTSWAAGPLGRRCWCGGPAALTTWPRGSTSCSVLPEAERQGALNEVWLLRKLLHPNVVRMVDSFKDNSFIVIVPEYAKFGDLDVCLSKQHAPLPEGRVMELFSQLYLAL